ncbi:MAG: DUF2948 family protein [Rhodobacteraceae bacterium]|jgi:hypothetical protein|nr:DUF2948 family protein [Paracoccaceae bacterium]
MTPDDPGPEDARFADGAERPLALRAFDADDLSVISTLAQDAVLTGADMTWHRRARRFALLINRFRWEDADAARRQGRPPERARALLSVEDVRAVRTQGISRDADTVLSLLSLAWTPTQDGTGQLVLTFSGDGAIAITAEALEVTLRDVTRPYTAPSGRTPGHGD